jgi:hypothetical protein
MIGGHPVAALLVLTCIAISGRAETISSNGQQSSQNANTIRSDPQGAPAKVVRPPPQPPPQPQPLVIVPVNPPNQRPSHSRH